MPGKRIAQNDKYYGLTCSAASFGTTAASSSLSINGSNFSVALWTHPDTDTASSNILFLSAGVGYPTDGILINQFGSSLFLYFKTGAPLVVGNGYFGIAPPQSGDVRGIQPFKKWFRLVVTFNTSTNTVTAYRDGLLFLQTVIAAPGAFAATPSLQFGGGAAVTCKLSDIVFSNTTEWSATDVANDYFYNKDFPSITNRWEMQENFGSIANSSTNTLNYFTLTSPSWLEGPSQNRQKSDNWLYDSEDLSNNTNWSKVNTTVTPNSIIAPNGTTTASMITDSNDGGSTSHYLNQFVSTTHSGVVTLSAFVKAGTKNFFALAPDGAAVQVMYNLSTGNIDSFLNGTNLVRRYGMEDAGNGWYRCWVTFYHDMTFNNFRFYICNSTGSLTYTGAGTGTIYMWGTQLSMGEKLKPYVWSNRQFRALNEAPPVKYENFLQYSEEFDNAYWTKVASSITANAVVGPIPYDNLTTADSLVDTGVNTNHGITRTVTGLVVGQSYTLSAWAKGNNRSWVVLSALNGTAQSWVNLAGASALGTSVGAIINRTFEFFANGWFKTSITFVATATSTDIGIYAANANGTLSYLGSTTSAIYIFGAQLTNSTTPQFYSRTGGSTVSNQIIYTKGENLLRRSQEFDNVTAWPLISTPTITPNTTIAPDGTLTGYTINDTSAVAFQGISQTYQLYTNATFTDNRPYTFTIYVKKNLAATSVCGFNYNLSGGTAQSYSFRINPVDGSFTIGGQIGDVEEINGWYRCWVSIINNGTNNAFVVGLYPATGTIVSGDNAATTGSQVFWGAQLSNSLGPVPYVRTYDRGTSFFGSGRSYNNKPNLLSRSSELDNAAWDKASYPVTISANSTTAPDGTLTADTVTASGGTTYHFATQQFPIQPWMYQAFPTGLGIRGQLVTYSAFVKAKDVPYVEIAQSTGGLWHRTWFDLSTESIGTIENGTNATLERYSNGWYRVSLTFNIDAAGTPDFCIGPTPAFGTTGTWAAGITSIYVWGCQVVYGMAPQPLSTTTSLQVSNSNTSFSARNQTFNKNLLLQSNTLNTTWSTAGGAATVTANADTAPDGTLTADRIFETNVSSAFFVGQAITVPTSQIYTVSGYFKKGVGRDWIALSSTGGASAVWFNINTGTIGSSSSTILDKDIVSVGNGWYLCWVSNIGVNTIRAYLANISGNASYAGNSANYVSAWGLQVTDGVGPKPLTTTTTTAINTNAYGGRVILI